jgi:hypothetical protein
MRALTGSPVLVADKLFATLDTTVRALHPESRPRKAHGDEGTTWTLRAPQAVIDRLRGIAEG